jgi:hypothetical protein
MRRRMINSVKIGTVLLCYLLAVSFFGNPFPKRLLGTYSGTQEAYVLIVEQDEVTVPSSTLSIELVNYEKALIRHGREVIKVDFTLEDKTKTYYNLAVTLENGERENWQLFRKGKKLIRPEIAPRPSSILLK